MIARALFALIIGLLGSEAYAAPIAPLTGDRVEILPKAVPARCNKRPGAKQILSDLCRDQSGILNDAKRVAAASGKTVLVAYGADWCIWCHVFEAHVLGGFGRFNYDTVDDPWSMDERGRDATMASEAAALKAFVSANFVIVNIAQEARPSGRAVLLETGADAHFNESLPFVFVLARDGRFARTVRTVDAEIRRDGDDPYRGYNRVKLLALLKASVEQ